MFVKPENPEENKAINKTERIKNQEFNIFRSFELDYHEFYLPVH